LGSRSIASPRPVGDETNLSLASLPPGTPPPPGAATRSPPDTLLGGERKQVTVLFADLCGYTALSERLDPEEVKDILNQVFSEVVKIVARATKDLSKNTLAMRS